MYVHVVLLKDSSGSAILQDEQYVADKEKGELDCMLLMCYCVCVCVCVCVYFCMHVYVYTFIFVCLEGISDFSR